MYNRDHTLLCLKDFVSSQFLVTDKKEDGEEKNKLAYDSCHQMRKTVLNNIYY